MTKYLDASRLDWHLDYFLYQNKSIFARPLNREILPDW